MKGGPHDTSPLGKGPGPRRLTDFEREVAHALMRAGHSESQAIQIARGRIADWAAGRGKVTAATRAKAQRSMAERAALSAKSHSLSVPTKGPAMLPSKVAQMTAAQKRQLALALLRKQKAGK